MSLQYGILQMPELSRFPCPKFRGMCITVFFILCAEFPWRMHANSYLGIINRARVSAVSGKWCFQAHQRIFVRWERFSLRYNKKNDDDKDISVWCKGVKKVEIFQAKKKRLDFTLIAHFRIVSKPIIQENAVCMKNI